MFVCLVQERLPSPQASAASTNSGSRLNPGTGTQGSPGALHWWQRTLCSIIYYPPPPYLIELRATPPLIGPFCLEGQNRFQGISKKNSNPPRSGGFFFSVSTPTTKSLSKGSRTLETVQLTGAISCRLVPVHANSCQFVPTHANSCQPELGIMRGNNEGYRNHMHFFIPWTSMPPPRNIHNNIIIT